MKKFSLVFVFVAMVFAQEASAMKSFQMLAIAGITTALAVATQPAEAMLRMFIAAVAGVVTAVGANPDQPAPEDEQKPDKL